MIVQSMVISTVSAKPSTFPMDRTWAAIFISINQYRSLYEWIVRGGILAVDPGQFEAATAQEWPMDKPCARSSFHRLFTISCQQQEWIYLLTSRIHLFFECYLWLNCFTGNTKQLKTTNTLTFTIIAVIYFVLTFTITRILRYIERRLDSDAYTTVANQMQVKEVK